MEDLFSHDVEPLPTPWDEGYAIDTAWHRDTYIALNQTDRGIIRFERSLAGPGRLLGPSHYSPFPARDRDPMWLCNPEGRKHGEPHVAQEVDGNGRVVRELNLPGGAFLRGELDKGFFVEIGSGHFMWSGRGPIKERLLTEGWFVGIVQNILIWVAVDSPGTLRWVGAHERAVTPLVVDRWSHIWLSPAPFGSRVAITFDSTAKGRGGLAIVDLATASCTTASGDFKYSSYKPVWSLDGARFLPFEISPPTTWLIPAVLRAALLQLWSPDSRHLVLIVIRSRQDEMLWPGGGRINDCGHGPRHKQHRAALGGGVVTESRVVLGRERRHRRTWNVILPIRRPI